MIFGGRKFEEFKPARRVFAGRGRSMLTFGEWKIALFSMAFGGALVSGWLYGAADPAEKIALLQPPLTFAAAEPNRAQDHSAAAIAPYEASSAVADVSPVGADYYIAQAARVVSGDTFYLEGVSVGIGLWGVKSPARHEPGFGEASEMLAALIADRTLSCEHMDSEPNGRILARCYFEDGAELSEEMVKAGAATALSHNL